MARPKASDYDEKRVSILSKAASLIAERGYAGASLSLIAKECDFSKSLTYHYYPDKDSLLFDIIFCHLNELAETVEEAAARAKSPRRKLEAMAIALLEAYRDHDAEHDVQISSLKLLSPDRQGVLKNIERRLVRMFSAVIAELLPSGANSDDLLKPLTMSLFGMLNWHYLWFKEGKGMERADYARLACRLVVDGSRKVTASPPIKPRPEDVVPG
ncbi:MAG: TetR/AcrR family transcriptional regulator [Beijerinckiaceae bacterium]|nr:TetR/AcrR family transcriptional regulator [Beijerinckiaceae bacterium]